VTKGGNSKSLKDQNRWQLWLTIALNAVVFYAVVQSDAITATGWKGLLAAAPDLLPVGFAFIVTSVANGLLSANMKARLVFWRWAHALPGHRAFSKYAPADPRIDLDHLKKYLGNKLPEGPEAENKVWYRMFKEVEAAPEVSHIHREFLFMRDYTGFSALFLVGLGIATLFLVQSWKVALTYWLVLLLQFIVVRHVAATYGARFVCTVLALKSAQLAASSPRKRKASGEGGNSHNSSAGASTSRDG
jgi:hypothetical protein